MHVVISLTEGVLPIPAQAYSDYHYMCVTSANSDLFL